MKIVYSTDNYHPRVSGMATSVDRFKKYLERRGHDVHVLAPWYPGTYCDPPRVYRFKSISFLLTHEDRLVVPWAKKEVYRVLDQIRPDIIHVQTEFGMGSLTKGYALKKHIPLAMSAHTSYEQYVGCYFPWLPKRLSMRVVRWLMQDYYRPARIMICPSPQMRDLLMKYGLENQIHIVPTGIDTEEFAGVDKGATRQASPLFINWPELKGKKILAYVGRVGYEKNVEMLLPVLAQVKTACDNAFLLVTGEGPYLEQMKIDARRLSLADRVVFTGYGDRHFVREVLGLADVFVFPSLSESQGLVTGEAMACGTPVVAIGEMGTKWVMGGDNGGYMVPNCIESFSAAVIRLLQDSELWKRKSIEAIEWAERWKMEVMAERLEALYLDERSLKDADLTNTL